MRCLHRGSRCACSVRMRCDVSVTLAASGQCGSCWAFGTGGSFADRLCIASNASKVRCTLPASAVPARDPRSPPIAYTCFLSLAFRFSRMAHLTKRSSPVTKSPPTTAARAASLASCGTGLKPSASPQTNAFITPQVLAMKRPPARTIS